MRVAGLCRVSTEGQAARGESLRVQRQVIEAACRQRGVAVAVWYSGQEHATPAQERSIFEGMLRDAATDGWDAVMVADTSRWSRDNEASKRAIRVLNEHKKRFFVGTMEIPIRSAIGRNLLGLQVEMAEGTAGVSVEKSIASKLARLRAGIGDVTETPYARRFDRASNRWIVAEAEAKQLRRAYDMVVTRGYSLRRVALALGQSAPTWRNRLLGAGASRTVTMKDEFGDAHEFKQDYPAILTPAEQTRLREALAVSKTSGRAEGSRVYVLRGKLRCGACGQTLCGQPDRKTYRYAHKEVIGPDNQPIPRTAKCLTTVPGEWIEEQVFGHIFKSLSSQQGIRDAIRRGLDTSDEGREVLESRKQELEREYSVADKKLGAKLALVEKMLDSLRGTAFEREKKAIARMNESIADIERELRQVTADLAAISVNSDLAAQAEKTVKHLLGHDITKHPAPGDMPTWSTKQKIALVEALFGAGSLRRQENVGVYLHRVDKREFALDIKGRFGPIEADWPEDVKTAVGASVDPKFGRPRLTERQTKLKLCPYDGRMQRFYNEHRVRYHFKSRHRVSTSAM